MPTPPRTPPAPHPRPAPHTRPAPRTRAPGSRPVRRAVTGRALVLGVVVVLLLVVLASPLSRYVASRTALGDKAQQLRQHRAQVAELRREVDRWGDPGYVQDQARRRLQYAMPGDTTYVVVGQGQQNDLARTSGAASPAASGGWNTRLWSSIEKADSAR